MRLIHVQFHETPATTQDAHRILPILFRRLLRYLPPFRTHLEDRSFGSQTDRSNYHTLTLVGELAGQQVDRGSYMGAYLGDEDLHNPDN